MKCFYRVAVVAMGLTTLCAPTWAATGDVTRGERMYRACVACHSLERNRNMTGPSLAEIWIRRSGSLPSFPLPRSRQPASSGTTTRSTNGSRTRSISFPETR
jgi:cytochrome c2